MTRPLRLSLLVILLTGLAGCAAPGDGGAVMAPEPLKPIDTARFFTGRWYEIARVPQRLTDGCVSGTTDYFKDADGQLIDRDACRTDTPEGKEVVYPGPVGILDPGKNTKVTVRYEVWGIFHTTWTFWFLDHADDYSWFIVSDPQFQNVSYFTRTPRPSKATMDMLTEKVRAFGFDPKKLEYPTQFPPGEQ